MPPCPPRPSSSALLAVCALEQLMTPVAGPPVAARHLQMAPGSTQRTRPTRAAPLQVCVRLPLPCNHVPRMTRNSKTYCRVCVGARAAMFKVDEEELLDMNRRHYPTLAPCTVLAHGSPIELPQVGSHGGHGRAGKRALKFKRKKEALSPEEWLDIEVFSSSTSRRSNSRALLLYR